MLTMDALDSLAQVATDQLVGFDPNALYSNAFLTHQLYRQAPTCFEDFSMAQVVSEDPTMFNVDLTEQTVPGSLTRFLSCCRFRSPRRAHPSPSQSRPTSISRFLSLVSRGTRNIVYIIPRRRVWF